MIVLEGDFRRWAPPAAATAIGIGVFDGVHRGHQRVLAALRDQAAAAGLSPVVLTFDRHPLDLVDPDRSPRRLMTLGQRLELFAAAGIEAVAVLHFDEEVRDLTPEEFVAGVLVDGLAAAVVAVGADFRFGRERAGDLAVLTALGARSGFEVRVVDLLGDGAPVSSTRIREAVLEGRVEDAASDLGRWYELRGVVVPGDGCGAGIGFPTANLDLAPAVAVPGHGVYAVRVLAAGRWYDGVVNVGIRPTFGGSTEVVEVHLLDYDGPLYGDELTVWFVARLRGEQRFDGVEALVDQIRLDVGAARRLLSAADGTPRREVPGS